MKLHGSSRAVTLEFIKKRDGAFVPLGQAYCSLGDEDLLTAMGDSCTGMAGTRGHSLN